MAAITTITVTATTPDKYNVTTNAASQDADGATARQMVQVWSKIAMATTQKPTDTPATLTVPAGFGS